MKLRSSFGWGSSLEVFLISSPLWAQELYLFGWVGLLCITRHVCSWLVLGVVHECAFCMGFLNHSIFLNIMICSSIACLREKKVHWNGGMDENTTQHATCRTRPHMYNKLNVEQDPTCHWHGLVVSNDGMDEIIPWKYYLKKNSSGGK